MWSLHHSCLAKCLLEMPSFISPHELVCKHCFDNTLICFVRLLQVSFYRGEIPKNLPEEVARKRKGDDSQWLATLPLRLPVSWNESFFPYFMVTLIYFYY